MACRPASLRQHDLVDHAHIEQRHAGIPGEIDHGQFRAHHRAQLGLVVAGENIGAGSTLLQRDDAPLGGQLFQQYALVANGRAGHQDAIKRPQVRGAAVAVLLPQHQVGQPQGIEPSLGGAGQGRVDLHGHHLRRQLAQQGREVAGTGAHLQYLVAGFNLRVMEYLRDSIGRGYAVPQHQVGVTHLDETVAGQHAHHPGDALTAYGTGFLHRRRLPAAITWRAIIRSGPAHQG